MASGQTIPVSGSGTTLSIVGTSTYGSSSGSGTIIYTDGSTQSYSLGFADWWSTSAAQGTDFIANPTYINGGSGKITQAVNLSYAAIPLQAGKTVQAVVLPTISAGAVRSSVSMHIFDVSVSGTSRELGHQPAGPCEQRHRHRRQRRGVAADREPHARSGRGNRST